MITFRKMNEREFEDLINFNRSVYISDLEHYEEYFKEHHQMSAREFGEKQNQELIEQGLDDPNQKFWILEDEDVHQDIGFLWITIRDNVPIIADIYIEQNFRNRGYGTEILKKVDNLIKNDEKYNRIVLYCFRHNPRAKKLYEKLGYQVVREIPTSYRMEKCFN